MPNLDEFLNKPEAQTESIENNSRLEKHYSIKPCNQCDSDSDYFYFNNQTMEMSWTCANNHHNKYQVG